MNYYKYERRNESKTSDDFRWVVKDAEGEQAAVCKTEAKAKGICAELNELKQLRIILAWHSKSLTTAQACAALGTYYKPEDLERLLKTCLQNAFK